MYWIPEDGIGVEALGGVKPELELHFPVAFALREHIGRKSVREAAEELKVDHIVREIEFRFRLAGMVMEWGSESEASSGGEEEESFLLSGDGGGPFSFALESILGLASSCGLVVSDAL
ncbi:hypothetical protein ZIOFF_000744 [Zingiber officinale]|uniref:Uncharacterized protein n=1 Tax=Zingiber officinale TaxID=94328 RepID=A0A8J5HU03_ZINOF|nr:hypothetical protein ZIOFF_000744 [Zingiber officinale]